MIPERLLRILRSCEDDKIACFPSTEVFNETWMLRLVLDAMQNCDVRSHPLSFLPESKWYSEARLSSPFRPKSRSDTLGEGFTRADGVIGHFDFRPTTNAGLALKQGARQFVVVEAKMFSNLSPGTKNAPTYDQAARNIACMAKTIAQSGVKLGDLESVGFFVIAPIVDRRDRPDTNLELLLNSASIVSAVDRRILSYEAPFREESAALRVWENDYFRPLVDRLVHEARVGVFSWEECIAGIDAADPSIGAEFLSFYKHCLGYGPSAKAAVQYR